MKKVTALLSSVGGYLLSAGNAVAASPSPLFKDPSGISADKGVGDVQQLVINLIFTIAGFLAVAYFMYGGVRWITSRGDKNAVTDARRTIVSALIGMVLGLIDVVVRILSGSMTFGRAIIDGYFISVQLVRSTMECSPSTH